MGDTGKSEVIKAFVHFAKGINFTFGWNYDTDVVKITALTGATSCEITNGRTLHSQACLNHTIHFIRTERIMEGNENDYYR